MLDIDIIRTFIIMMFILMTSLVEMITSPEYHCIFFALNMFLLFRFLFLGTATSTTISVENNVNLYCYP